MTDKEQAAQTLRVIAQALHSGIVDQDVMRVISEYSPSLMRELCEHYKMTAPELRKRAHKGHISSSILCRCLMKIGMV